nr:ExeM/NucH family extracellular endonuclease [Anaerolineaceae bacterium]
TMTCGAPVDVPPTISTTVPANGATNVGLTSDIKITFSEPVSLSEDWYSISCTVSGVHTATVTDANPIFTLDPAIDFSANETCTVTVDADKVLDQDGTPDPMASNYTFTFATAEGCGGPTTGIYDIQGTGMATTMAGQTHTVEGVVVGDYQVGGRNGFFIQEVVGDGNPATSDGIFIYAPGIADADVNLGDKLRVTGSVSEYYEQTQITNSAWQLCSSGNTIEPTVITLPVTAQTDFEKYEGMLVKFEQPLIVSEYFNFDRYGEIVLTTERFVTGTAKYEPGSDEYYDEIERFNLSKITLDDGRSQQNQHPAYHPNGAEFTLDNLFRGGGTVTNLVGVMDYYSNTYRLQPVFIGEYEDTNPRTAAPEIQEGDLTIASFNVLNYFVTLDGSGNRCGPSGNMECRGADNANEFTRQRAKILAAMNTIDADIFGLMEIENDRPGGQNPVADLVAGLNELKGAGTYAYIQTGSIGTDAIKQAIIYKPASVTPVGDYVTLTEAIDSRFDTSKNRPSLAQAFEDNASDVEFVVSVNHLKSKGSACDGDPDLGDGAGNCNIARTEAAQALADWLVPAKWNGIDKFLIIGDLNAYEKETPIDAIKAGADDTEGTDDDFVNTLLVHQGEDDDPYGYVFDGMVGYLDHALASPAMNALVLDAKFWHINADEADIIDYDTSFKPAAQAALLYAPDAYRSSDHDPVIVSLMTIPENAAPVAQDQDITTAEDTPIEITLVASDGDGDPLSYIIVDEPIHGDLSLVSGNEVTYTPDANYFGTDSFTFKANDGDLDSNTATVSISITSVEDLPVALPQDVSLNEDTSKEITLIASDGDGDTLTYSIVAQPTHGSLSLVSGNKFTYTPNANYFGGDSFTFKANDTKADSNIATVSITVLPVNDAPVAEDQNVSTDKNTSLEITLVASDIDGDSLTYSIRQNVSHGSLSVVDGNKVTYTPNANFSGMDSFTFRANDGSLNSNTATVVIMVNSTNVAPVAQAQTVETDEDLAKEITLVATDGDGDTLTYAIVDEPLHGSLSLLSGNKLTYTPDENYNGPDSFTFKANDGTLDSNIAKVTINVKPVNDAPVAYDQNVIAVAGETIEIELEALDIDGDILEFIIVEEPLHGTFELEGNILKYTPSATFGGVDKFTFKANDGSLDSNIATVTITVSRTQYFNFLPMIFR